MEKEIYQKGDTFRIQGVPYARFKTRAAAEEYLKPVESVRVWDTVVPEEKLAEKIKEDRKYWTTDEDEECKSADSTSPLNE